MNAKKILVPFLCCLLIACQKQTDSKAATLDSIAKVDSIAAANHNAKNSLDYVGTYKGILPCADCQGLETTICINENSTYSIKTQYQGKGDKIFTQKGIFSWNKKGNVIVLNDVQNGPNQYFVSENRLTQLDLAGKKISGELAADYILTKQPAAALEVETAVEHQSTETVDLNNRMEAHTVIKKVNPAVGKATLAETKWKLITLGGKVVAPRTKKEYFIKLNSGDGRFSAYAGCNTIAGNYVMPAAFTLSFSNVTMTRMACANMDVETRFSQMLENTERYAINDNILQLKKGRTAVLATFEPSK